MKNILLHPALPKFRRYIYRMLALGNAFFPAQRHTIIFSYHGIGNDDWRFGVSFDEFARQIESVEKAGYEAVTLDQVFDALDAKTILPKKAFVVTFDDGYRDVLLVEHYLAKKKIIPTLFVLAQPEKAERSELGTERQFLSQAEILQLHSHGWEIGCHSATHTDFSLLNSKSLEHETMEAKKILEEGLNIPIQYFAYPKGYTDKSIRAAVEKAGYRGALSMDDGFINEEADRFALPRIGVDRSHTLAEFPTLFMPAVILFRRTVKVFLESIFRMKTEFQKKRIQHS